jgi:hypothetical protein
VLLTAVLDFISDDEDPYATIRTLTGAIPPGSYLVISYITPDDVAPDAGGAAPTPAESSKSQGCQQPGPPIPDRMRDSQVT